MYVSFVWQLIISLNIKKTGDFFIMDEKENSNECTHDCSSCSASCSDRAPESLLVPANAKSSIKKVIGIVSGKGGVGKSMVTSLLAAASSRMGFSTAVLDADITGPSIPKMFGVSEKITGCEDGLIPAETQNGIKLMSVNLILDNESDPVLWRGPIIAQVVTQFWNEVVWGDVDFMFVDMPPGTGDVALTVFQSLPLDGIIVVTSPQELVSMIVGKAVKMAGEMNIPVLGIVENMSYLKCPDCGKEIKIFGESHVKEAAEEWGLEVLDRLPLDPSLAEAADSGNIESADVSCLDGVLTKLSRM